ncbi:MAG: hypothetical protein ACK506_01155 [Pirellula sp.]
MELEISTPDASMLGQAAKSAKLNGNQHAGERLANLVDFDCGVP